MRGVVIENIIDGESAVISIIIPINTLSCDRNFEVI